MACGQEPRHSTVPSCAHSCLFCPGDLTGHGVNTVLSADRPCGPWAKESEAGHLGWHRRGGPSCTSGGSCGAQGWGSASPGWAGRDAVTAVPVLYQEQGRPPDVGRTAGFCTPGVFLTRPLKTTRDVGGVSPLVPVQACRLCVPCASLCPHCERVRRAVAVVGPSALTARGSSECAPAGAAPPPPCECAQ